MFCFIIAFIVLFIIFNVSRKDYNVVGKTTINCKLDNEEYLYEVEYNKDFQVIYSGGDAWIVNHIDIFKYDDANQVIAHIEDYFKDHNGTCVID